MIYDWFLIFNLDAFNALDLTSKTYEMTLENIGPVEVLVTKGIGVSMLYNGVFLTVELNDKNPFEFENHAVFIKENNDVYLGIAVEES